MDGTVYSGEELAGLYLTDGKDPIRWENLTYTEKEETVTVWLTKEDARAVITFDETGICIKTNVKDFSLTPVYDKNKVFGTVEGADQFTKQAHESSLSFITRTEVKGNAAEFTFDGFDYSVTVAAGTLADDFSVTSDQGLIKIEF